MKEIQFNGDRKNGSHTTTDDSSHKVSAESGSSDYCPTELPPDTLSQFFGYVNACCKVKFK